MPVIRFDNIGLGVKGGMVINGEVFDAYIMIAKEIDRLADWLTAQGLPPTKVLECIKYIAGASAPEKSSG